MYQQPGYPDPQYGYAPPPQRSAIPKVIGILMIIFASLGLLGSLLNLAGGTGNSLMREIPELKTIRTVEMVTGLIGLGYGILHLYAGIRCVGYKSNAVSLAKAYAIIAMVVVVINAILTFVWMKPIMDKAFAGSGVNMGGMLGGFMFIGVLIGLAWPTLVLVLMTRPAAKAACVNP